MPSQLRLAILIVCLLASASALPVRPFEVVGPFGEVTEERAGSGTDHQTPVTMIRVWSDEQAINGIELGWGERRVRFGDARGSVHETESEDGFAQVRLYLVAGQLKGFQFSTEEGRTLSVGETGRLLAQPAIQAVGARQRFTDLEAFTFGRLEQQRIVGLSLNYINH